MSSSNNFASSFSRSFRKLFSKRSEKRTTHNHQDTFLGDGCSDSGISLANSDSSTWDHVLLQTPDSEKPRASQFFKNTENSPSVHTWSEQNSTWDKRPASNGTLRSPTSTSGTRDYLIDSSIFNELCTESNGVTPIEPPISGQRTCEKCTNDPRSPRKRCLCEFERTQNRLVEEYKPKKAKFIPGSLLKRTKSTRENQDHPSKKRRKISVSSSLIGPLFGRKGIFGSRGGKSTEKYTSAHESSTEDLSNPENLAKFEKKLQKVESFERMIVDPEYRDETIRLALTPNILT